MKFFFPNEPVGLQRPRIGKWGKIYSPQEKSIKADRWWYAVEMRAQNANKLDEGAIMASVTLHHPIPNSWPLKRRNAAVGASYLNTPDVDNCLKYYFDAMNTVAYHDDRQISTVWADQIYSHQPGVEIQLHSLGGDMIEEYAVTAHWEIQEKDLKLLVKKANKMGFAGRAIEDIKIKQTPKGKEIYFTLQSSKKVFPLPLC